MAKKKKIASPISWDDTLDIVIARLRDELAQTTDRAEKKRIARQITRLQKHS